MAYTVPSVDDFRDRFPKWTGSVASTSQIARGIARGQRNVDQTWTEGDYAEAILLYAAHWLTLAGVGPDAAAGTTQAEAGFGVKKMKTGDHEIEYAGATTLGQAGAIGDYALTVYGVQFAQLRRQNFAGVMTGCAPAGLSPAATDWPVVPPSIMLPFP